jgi:hypothetical protein
MLRVEPAVFSQVASDPTVSLLIVNRTLSQHVYVRVVLPSMPVLAS